MKAAIYARVSKGDGSQVLDNQLLRCREVCKNNGWIVAHEYLDQISGSKDSRPGLDQLRKESAIKDFDVVVVARLDRLGRSVEFTMRTIRELDEMGIQFVSCNEAINTKTPMGKAMIGFLAVFAQLERDIIIERTNMGLARAKAWGKQLGRKRLSTEKVDRIRALKAQGMSVKDIQIAEKLSRAGVYKALNPKYAAYYKGGRPIHKPPTSETP